MPIPQFTAGQVLTAAQLNAMVDAINAGGAMKVTAFTASGTFTPPAGVTYAVAHILAGGGGIGNNTVVTAGAGGNSSVAFAGGTITATGGSLMNATLIDSTINISAGQANSGNGAIMAGNYGASTTISYGTNAQDGAYVVAGGAVTAGVGITVTVGAGGTAGTSGAAGGSGYVWIEYAGS
jgi:hypothetical protein